MMFVEHSHLSVKGSYLVNIGLHKMRGDEDAISDIKDAKINDLLPVENVAR